MELKQEEVEVEREEREREREDKENVEGSLSKSRKMSMGEVRKMGMRERGEELK